MTGFAALAADAIEIHPGTPNVYYEQGIAKGEDTKPLIAKAAATVDITTYAAAAASASRAGLRLRLSRRRRRLTIHSKSIGLHLHHAMICPGLGVEPEKLRIIQNPTGGTFGYKFCPTMEALLGVAALATGRPVSLVYDQYQNITYTGKRSPGNVNIKPGRRQERQAHRDGDRLVDRPRPVFRVRRSSDHSAGSVHRRRLRIPRTSAATAARSPPTMRGARRSAPTARRRRSWPPRSPSTCWRRRWAWTRSSSATRISTRARRPRRPGRSRTCWCSASCST